jgi:tyrosyl-tRNA synthetase
VTRVSALSSFNYQILQAYDYLQLYQRHNCFLQMGGNDQWGNILAGVDLIRRVTVCEAYALNFSAAHHFLRCQDGQDGQWGGVAGRRTAGAL